MERQFARVDWVEVHARLTLAAYGMFGAARLAREERLLESYGDGPEDLANGVLCALLDPNNASVTWSTAKHGAPTTKDVFTFLAKIMRHDYFDKVRSKRRKSQQSLSAPDETQDNAPLLDPPDSGEDAEARLVAASHRGPLRKRLAEDFAARPDDELELYVMLQFDGPRYVPYKPREAAQELGLSVEDIYLIKDRFARRLRRLFRDELRAVLAGPMRDASHEQESR